MPVTIVALGSSSTFGIGASSRPHYPSRLAAELKPHVSRRSITVLNRGVNGEEVADCSPLGRDGHFGNPDLVLWQLGTNSLIRGTS